MAVKIPFTPAPIGNNITKTPTQSFVSGSSLLGRDNIYDGKPETKTPVVENKDSGASIIGKGLKLLPESIAKGVTSAVDSIADAPSTIGYALTDWQAGLDSNKYNYEVQRKAREAKRLYEKRSTNHILGDDVGDWEKRVDERQQQLVEDNPNSKLAAGANFVLGLGESIGEMAPTIAASVATGGLGAAAAGGTTALALRGANVASKIGKAAQAAGLGTMFMNVYDKSVDDSLAQGYDASDAGQQAFGDALLEVGAELLFGGIAGLGKGITSEAAQAFLNKSVAKTAGSAGAKKFISTAGIAKAGTSIAEMIVKVDDAVEKSEGLRKLLYTGLGEGAEEMISEFFGPYIERMTTNPNAESATLSDMLQAGLGGALISFAMAPLGRIHRKATESNEELMHRARVQMFLSNTNENVNIARALVNDGLFGDAMIEVAETQLGRKLPSKIEGVRSAALRSPGSRLLANDLIDKAEAEGTVDAVSNMWAGLSDLFEQESQSRADEAAAKIFEERDLKAATSKDPELRRAEKEAEAAEAAAKEAELDAAAANLVSSEFLGRRSTGDQYTEQMLSKVTPEQMEEASRVKVDVTPLGRSARRNRAPGFGQATREEELYNNLLNRITEEQKEGSLASRAAERTLNKLAGTTVAETADAEAISEVPAEQDTAGKATLRPETIKAMRPNASTNRARRAAEAKARLTEASSNLEAARRIAEERTRERLARANAEAVYGEEVVRNFEAAQRFADAKSGRFIARNEDGERVLYNRNSYSREKFGKTYNQLSDEQKAEVEKAYNGFFEEIRHEQEQFVADINNALEITTNGELSVKLVDKTTDGTLLTYSDGVIYVDRSQIFSKSAVLYYLPHEMLHWFKAAKLTEQQVTEFYGELHEMMDLVGVDFKRLCAVTASVYDKFYRKRFEAKANEMHLKGDKRKRFIEEQCVAAYEEEAFARFMSIAFGSTNILEAMASGNRHFVEQMREGLEVSSLSQLIGTQWDFERLKVLDRITKALDAPKEPDEEKKAEIAEEVEAAIEEELSDIAASAAESVDMGFVEITDDIEIAPVFYSKMERTVEGFKENKLAANTLVQRLIKSGVKAEEIKWSGIETWLEGKKAVTKDELLNFIRDNKLEIEEVRLSDPETYKVADSLVGPGESTRIASDAIDFFLMETAERLIDAGRLTTADGKKVNDVGELNLFQGSEGQVFVGDTEGEEVLADLFKPLVAEPADNNHSRWGKFSVAPYGNYRELLFAAPDTDYINTSMESHWGRPGVIAHARVDDVVSDGKNILFVEELQSDWHNLGSRKGYTEKSYKEIGLLRQRLLSTRDEVTDAHIALSRAQSALNSAVYDVPTDRNRQSKWQEHIRSLHDKVDQLRMEYDAKVQAFRAIDRELIEAAPRELVPNAPFKNGAYTDFVMKRLLHEAAKNNYDAIAWTDASAQMHRWNPNRMTLGEMGFGGDQSKVAFEEGYRIEYDQQIPKFMNKFGKQFGVQAEQTTIELDGGNTLVSCWIMPITDEMRNSVLTTGFPMFSAEITDDIDLTEEKLRQYEELREKYGSRYGAPTKLNENTAVSQTAARMIGTGYVSDHSPQMSEEFINRLKGDLLNGVFSHVVITDKTAKQAAETRIGAFNTISQAYDDAVNNVFNGRRVVNKEDIAFGEQLLVDMAGTLREIEDGTYSPNISGKTDTTELYNQMENLIAKLCSTASRAGQNLQAFSLLKKLTPQGRLYYCQSEVDNLVSELVDRKGQSRVGGYRFLKMPDGTYARNEKGEYVKLEIDKRLQEKLLNCTTEEEMRAVEDEIITNIASKIPPSVMDRVVAWRYLAMLGNPRTHIRNIASNFIMGSATYIKDLIGGTFEDAYFKDSTGGRTKTRRSLPEETKDILSKFVDKDWAEGGMKDQTLSGGKVGFQSRIEEARNKLGPLDPLAKKNMELMELADDRAALRNYKRSFLDYVAANNLTPELLMSGTVQGNVALAQARSYASKQAQKAVYRDASAVATMLNNLEKQNAFSKLIVGGLLPFKKTPINVLSRGVEYSPAGLLAGGFKFLKLRHDSKHIKVLGTDGKVRTLNKDQFSNDVYGKPYSKLDPEQQKAVDNRFLQSMGYEGEYSALTSEDAARMGTDPKVGMDIARARMGAREQYTLDVANAIDQIAAGLTGTGIAALGALFYALGLLKAGGGDNDTEEYYDQMLGNQPYSITIGKNNYTLDWMTPVSMPLFAGAIFAESWMESSLDVNFTDVIDAMGRIMDPVMNLSVLQGINDAMSSYDSDLSNVLFSAAESYAGQFVPTVFGQVARTIDPTRRTTYASKDDPMGKEFATFRNRIENKIPGLSDDNAAYVDQWGRTETNSGDNIFERLFHNAVAPYYVREQNKTKADDLVTKLFAQTGDRTVIPRSPETSYTIDNQTFYLTSDEYQKTKELVGQLSAEGVNSLVSVPGFDSLPAEDQAYLVSQVYTFSRKVAQSDYAAANGIPYSEQSYISRLKNAVANGLTIGAAVYINYMTGQMEADKDPKTGKTISGSKKAKVLSFYQSLGLTKNQIEAISTYDYD